MDYDELVAKVIELLQREKRVPYRSLKRRFELDDDYIEDLIDIVRHNCGITESASPETSSDKVRVALQEVGMDAEESAPYLLQLLGVKAGTEALALLTPEAIRARTFDTLRQMSLQGSQRRPLIFEVEDLHWIDKTSEAYLASFVESLTGAAILLLTTYRPGYRPPWIDKSYATQLSLRNLTPQDSATVVHSTSHRTTLPVPLEHMIIAKAEGNPFFLEELTRVVIEHGDAETARDVPDTIQGVLMARIDRLPEAHKRLLQTASVLGREFSPRLLAAIWEGTDPLTPLFLELQRLELLFVRTGADEPLYVFKHALTQEVAYTSLLRRHRHALHAAAGQALEALYADRLEEVHDRLAYHYVHTDQAASMRGWIYAHCGAWQEGLAACQHALEYAPDAYETALNLGFLGYMYLEKGEVTQALPVLESAVQAAQQYRSQQVQSSFKVFLGEAYRMNNQLEQAQDLAMQGCELSRRIKHPWGIGLAQRTLGRIAHTSGNLAVAEMHLQDALATFDAIQARYDLARTHLDLTSLAHTQGNQDTATTHLNQAYAWFKTLQVSKWVERTEQLAHEYGVTLAEVALEEVSEGEA